MFTRGPGGGGAETNKQQQIRFLRGRGTRTQLLSRPLTATITRPAPVHFFFVLILATVCEPPVNHSGFTRVCVCVQVH